jgi:hypothetical protein
MRNCIVNRVGEDKQLREQKAWNEVFLHKAYTNEQEEFLKDPRCRITPSQSSSEIKRVAFVVPFSRKPRVSGWR